MNLKYEAQKCFMWSIFTYLHPLPGFLPPKLNEKDCQNSVDLFLYEDSKWQCYLVNNFGRLLQTQVSKQNWKLI